MFGDSRTGACLFPVHDSQQSVCGCRLLCCCCRSSKTTSRQAPRLTFHNSWTNRLAPPSGSSVASRCLQVRLPPAGAHAAAVASVPPLDPVNTLHNTQLEQARAQSRRCLLTARSCIATHTRKNDTYGPKVYQQLPSRIPFCAGTVPDPPGSKSVWAAQRSITEASSDALLSIARHSFTTPSATSPGAAWLSNSPQLARLLSSEGPEDGEASSSQVREQRETHLTCKDMLQLG